MLIAAAIILLLAQAYGVPTGGAPVPVIPILGAWKPSQFQDNVASLDLTLSIEQLKALDEASRIELVRAICYGGLRDQILA